MAGKYGAKRQEVDGITFDSKKEAGRYKQLSILERAGQITDLELQVAFELAPRAVIQGRTKPALRYVCDFRYRQDGEVIVEDVKGVRTEAYRIKRHLMKTVHGIDIKEV